MADDLDFQKLKNRMADLETRVTNTERAVLYLGAALADHVPKECRQVISAIFTDFLEINAVDDTHMKENVGRSDMFIKRTKNGRKRVGII